MACVLLFVSLLALGGFLLYQKAPAFVWALAGGLLISMAAYLELMGMYAQAVLIAIEGIVIVSAIPLFRRHLLTPLFFKKASAAVTPLSTTEYEALQAGTVGIEREFFSGSPNFSQKPPTVCLTQEEQVFLDGPVNELCAMLNDWEVTHELTDLPKNVWDFIKHQGFLGMIIPKQYGGLGFSATAQASVLIKIYSHSISAATSISVPNSLGPSELLLKYGTPEQKEHYLPRLACGEEIPCFALTEPNAGSDAASITAKGIVCRGLFEGKECLGIKLNWDKRYITLCPVATIIGLAFKLYDPDGLLQRGQNIGISCALIPANTPGVVQGRRHFPLNTAFLNGPTQGRDVFIPIDYLIGGVAQAGHGWSMLMECLSAGRAISLPSSAVGGAQAACLASGAYAQLRKQFKRSIGSFEGIQEPLARIAANTYIIDAALRMTTACIDHGARPAIASALLKYHCTERARAIAIDAMDIHGGKGICLGPNNYLGRGYQGMPIAITVEGANILTRNLIIFGQGVIRCHPYIQQELESIRLKDKRAFDETFWAHVGFFLGNATKAFVFSFTKAYGTKAPKGPTKRYYQLIHLYSAYFSFLSDFALFKLGGSLKRKEFLSARLGDVFSRLYLIFSVLKRYEDEEQQPEDIPLVHWSCQQLFYECRQALEEIILNFPGRLSRGLLSLLLRPSRLRQKKPKDVLSKEIAKIITNQNATRARLCHLVYAVQGPNCPLGNSEAAFTQVLATAPVEKKLNQALKENKLKAPSAYSEKIALALAHHLITPAEAQQLLAAEESRQQAIRVDDFADSELRRASPRGRTTVFSHGRGR